MLVRVKDAVVGWMAPLMMIRPSFKTSITGQFVLENPSRRNAAKLDMAPVISMNVFIAVDVGVTMTLRMVMLPIPPPSMAPMEMPGVTEVEEVSKTMFSMTRSQLMAPEIWIPSVFGEVV